MQLLPIRIRNHDCNIYNSYFVNYVCGTGPSLRYTKIQRHFTFLIYQFKNIKEVKLRRSKASVLFRKHKFASSDHSLEWALTKKTLRQVHMLITLQCRW
jgi:hypothetical protein